MPPASTGTGTYRSATEATPLCLMAATTSGSFAMLPSCTSSPPMWMYGDVGNMPSISRKSCCTAATTEALVKSTIPIEGSDAKANVRGKVPVSALLCPGTSISPTMATPRTAANTCSSASSAAVYLKTLLAASSGKVALGKVKAPSSVRWMWR